MRGFIRWFWARLTNWRLPPEFRGPVRPLERAARIVVCTLLVLLLAQAVIIFAAILAAIGQIGADLGP